MTDQNERRVAELLELSSQEMEQVQGGDAADYLIWQRGGGIAGEYEPAQSPAGFGSEYKYVSIRRF